MYHFIRPWLISTNVTFTTIKIEFPRIGLRMAYAPQAWKVSQEYWTTIIFNNKKFTTLSTKETLQNAANANFHGPF